MKRIALLLLATAAPLVSTASAFAWCHHHCGRVVYTPVVTGAPAHGVGTVVTPAHSFAVMPSSSFAVTPAASFASIPLAPTTGMQLSFSLPVALTGGQQAGIQPLPTTPHPSTIPTAVCVTEAQVRALLDARLATTDAKLKDIYDLLVLIARDRKLQVPAPKGFSMSTPSPDARRNMDETRRLLTQIERKQVAWTAPATAPAVQADPRTAEVRRLLAEISAKQAAWNRPAEAAVSVSSK